MPHKDPEAGKAYHRAYQEKHRERLAQRQAELYQKNKVARRAYSLQWHRDNRERAIEISRQWHRAQPWWSLIRGAKERAVKKGVPFSLTLTWGRETWTGVCSLTGLSFVEKIGNGPGPRSPSIDRIDPALGYVPSNCRFILACVNSFKHSGTEAEMFEVIDALMTQKAAPVMPVI